MGAISNLRGDQAYRPEQADQLDAGSLQPLAPPAATPNPGGSPVATDQSQQAQADQLDPGSLQPLPSSGTPGSSGESIANSPTDNIVRGAISPTEGIELLKGFGHGMAATAAGAMDLADKLTGGDPEHDSEN